MAGPTSVDPELWLDADDAATFTFSSGVVVSQWDDKSGNARHAAQATVGNQPSRNGTLNSMSTVVFDGSNDELAGSAPVITAIDNYSIFVVCRRTGGSGFQCIPFFNGSDPAGNGYGPAVRANSGTNIGWLAGGIAWTTTGFADDGDAHILALIRAAGTSTVYLDGAADTPTATTTPATPTVKYSVAAPSHPFGGDVAEILMYDTALGTTDRQDVETYLTTKWFGPPPPGPQLRGPVRSGMRLG